MNGHHAQAESTGAYALDALSAIEARAFERHLAGCLQCQAELDGLRVAVAALPRSVEQLPAPPGLRRAVMSQVEADVRARARSESEQRALCVRHRRCGVARPRGQRAHHCEGVPRGPRRRSGDL